MNGQQVNRNKSKKKIIIILIIVLLICVISILVFYFIKVKDSKKDIPTNDTQAVVSEPTEEENTEWVNLVNELNVIIDSEIKNINDTAICSLEVTENCLTEEEKNSKLEILNNYKEQVNSLEENNNEKYEEIKKSLDEYLNPVEEDLVEEDNNESNTGANVTSSGSDKTTNSSSNKTSSSSSNKTSTSSSSSQFKKDINSVKLNPIKTNRKYVDDEIEKIINKIITKDMSNYEKLVAAYDYVIKNMKYNTAHNVLDLNLLNERYGNYRYYYYDEVTVYWAENALIYKDGVCDTYAGFLQVLTRRIGFETYTITGYNTSGGGHTWNVIAAGSNRYMLDAQGDDKGSTSNNYYFGVNLNDYKKRYSGIKSLYQFHDFKEYEDLYVVGTMGGKTIKSNVQFLNDDVIERIMIKTGESLTLSVKSEGGEGTIRSYLSIKKPDGTFDSSYASVAGSTASNIVFKPYEITYTFPENGMYQISATLFDNNNYATLQFYIYVTSTGDKYFEE